jgi:signal transduction histidine kinase
LALDFTIPDPGNNGLPIAKWIVESQNGTFAVPVNLERGSTFIVRIPITDK